MLISGPKGKVFQNKGGTSSIARCCEVGQDGIIGIPVARTDYKILCYILVTCYPCHILRSLRVLFFHVLDVSL